MKRLIQLFVCCTSCLFFWACQPPEVEQNADNSTVVTAPEEPKPTVRIPAPSPAASVSQVVGVTKVSIDYSAPSVKGRKIWGELEPYGKAWRAGANAATKITFQDNVTINGKELKAGSYVIFITPRENAEWTVHLNTGANIFAYNDGEGEQDMEKLMAADAVSIDVAPQLSETFQERLAYSIQALSDTEGLVVMNWEEVKVSFPFQIKTNDVVEASMGNASTSDEMRNAANYYLKRGELEKASVQADKSIELRADHFMNRWIKARILAEQGKKDEAISAIKDAIAKGEAAPDNAYNFYKDQLQKHLEEWESN